MALSASNSHITEVTKVCDLESHIEEQPVSRVPTCHSVDVEAIGPGHANEFGAQQSLERVDSMPKSPIHSAFQHFRAGANRSMSIESTIKVTDHDLQEAALRGDVQLVKTLIRQGSSVNAPMRCNDPDSDVFATLLHVLSSRPELPNNTQVMNEIVRMNANLNARSSIGTTPLTRACIHKHVRAVELLLVYGADVRPRDDCGRDAVMCSVMLFASSFDAKVPSKREVAELSAQLVSLLAEKGADLDQIGIPNAPLLEAIHDKNHLAVVALTEHGAQPRFLHEAVEDAPTSIIEHLLKAQANSFEEDSEGQTVLDIAFRRGDEEITTLLRDHIGDLERKRGRPMPVKKEVSIENVKDDTSQEDAGGLGLSGSADRKKDSRKEGTAGRLSLRRVSQAGSNLLQYQRSKNRNKAPKQDSPKLIAMRKHWTWAQRTCLNIYNSKTFQLVMLTALLAALFLPDMWVLCDFPRNDDLDIILVLVLILFIFEVLVQAIGMPEVYINSFFFWMDLIGACSVPLDHSAVNDNLPRNFDNAVVMRAARMARLGARAGRFTKLVKLLRFLPGVNQDRSSGGTAKVMSNALMQSLSTRVSCLIIVMVMVLPLFDLATYPENDFSMKTWMNSLDFTTSHYPTEVQNRIDQFMNFYNNKDYYPFDITLQWPNGTNQYERRSDRVPRREKNEIEIKADSGNVWSNFNFGEKSRVDAICNIVLIVTIIILMMGFSLLLSNSVSAIVLIPLENLLSGVKKMASKIFTSVTSISKKVGPEGDDSKKKEDEIFGNETELLEKVIDKLAALNAITMKSSPIDAETLAHLGEGERAVTVQLNSEQLPTIPVEQVTGDGTVPQLEDQTGDNAANLVLVLEKHLDEAGIAWGYVDSWDFNVLAIEDHQRHLVCLCFLIFHLGLGYRSDIQQTLTNFSQAAAKGYASPELAPYHNWFHAVDVTHSVFRLLSLCSTERFLSGHERYALIVSAMCHDIGHAGLNNQFLVETSHELAIRYNDNSPLENMHCAKLFEIVGQPKTAVFSQLDKAQYREVRQVCIEAILHTDNTHHFTMVKELVMLYEMNSDVFDISLQMYQSSQIEFPPKEIVDIFSEPEKKKLIRNMFLHFCDVSNPVKPFTICKQWAWQIVDEFFLQGDKEKELGITVQPLNDREKVNRPYSQVGFIEFFVAPFAFATVRLLPPLVMLTDQMIQNLNSWCEEWISTTTPTPDAEEQSKLQDRIAKLEAKYIFRDGF